MNALQTGPGNRLLVGAPKRSQKARSASRPLPPPMPDSDAPFDERLKAAIDGIEILCELHIQDAPTGQHETIRKTYDGLRYVIYEAIAEEVEV